MKFPKAFEALIRQIAMLPGVGRKTAERYSVEIVSRWSDSQRKNLIQILQDINSLKLCTTCGILSEEETCSICSDPLRDLDFLCCVASLKDLFSIESSGRFSGTYHIVDSLLSPMDGRGVEKLKIQALDARMAKKPFREVLLAFDPSVEGEASARYLKQFFESKGVKVSRLAFGIPLHSTLEYVDGGTLGMAIEGRVRY